MSNEKLVKLTLKKPSAAGAARKVEPVVLTNMAAAAALEPSVRSTVQLVSALVNKATFSTSSLEKLKDDPQSSSDNQSEETCKDEQNEGHIQIQNINGPSGLNKARNFIYNGSPDEDDSFEDGDQPYAERKQASQLQ